MPREEGERRDQMSQRLRVLSAGIESRLAEVLRRACVEEGYEYVDVDPRDLSERIRSKSPPDLIVLAEDDPDSAVRVQAIRQETAGVLIPVIAAMGVDRVGKTPRNVGADAYLKEPVSKAELVETIRRLARQGRTLESGLRRVDPRAQVLVENERCEWVKSVFGILGLIRISPETGAHESSAQGVARRIKQGADEAYALLDALPEERLSLEDVWNLLLFISVPWTQEEIGGLPELAAALFQIGQDTSGSRKIVLPRGASPLQHIGRMGGKGTPWIPSSPDPLRDAVRSVSRDDIDREALDVLFKARIGEADLDRLIQALARRID